VFFYDGEKHGGGAMYLTGRRKGLFTREIVIARDGVRQAVLKVRGLVSTLTLEEEGAQHEYGILSEAGRLSLYWRAQGADIVTMSPMHSESFTEGFVWQGVRYSLIKDEKRVFRIMADGRKFGEIRHEGGVLSSRFSLETAQDIPVESAVFMLFLSLAHPALRWL
jgi:hypothetical protein